MPSKRRPVLFWPAWWPMVSPATVADTDSGDPPVPEAHRALYDELAAAIPEPPAAMAALEPHEPRFGADHDLLNSNRGTQLLGPYVQDQARMLTTHLARDVGARQITISAHENLFRTPEAPQYVALWRDQIEYARSLGMAVVVESQAGFSTDYAGTALAQHLVNRRHAAEVIAAELRPDYLVVVEEPDTEAALTGIPELLDRGQYVAFARQLVDGLDLGQTKVGVGVGNWTHPDWLRALLDSVLAHFASLHVYPVVLGYAQRAAELGQVAASYGLRVGAGEMWLLKQSARDVVLRVSPQTAFRRDVYDFWSPLDRRFLSWTVGLARQQGWEYHTAFWRWPLNYYLPYDDSTKSLTYEAGRLKVGYQAAINAREGVLSATGTHYRDLIAAV